MRTIILCGEHSQGMLAYEYLDAALRARGERDLALCFTYTLDPEAAHALRDGGGELWYCGPMGEPPAVARHADRHLLGDTQIDVQMRADTFLREFLNKTRVAAA